VHPRGHKAILQSGVAYVGGYQGAPVRIWSMCWSNRRIFWTSWAPSRTCHQRGLGGALLGASINYRSRCVTWKSIVGTNVPPMHSATLPRRA